MTISLTPGLICILGSLLGIFMRGTAKKTIGFNGPCIGVYSVDSTYTKRSLPY